MAVCHECSREMTTAASCTAREIELHGRMVQLTPFGSERARRSRYRQCGDCGVSRGGYHHPGCDLEECPLCCGQFLSCGCGLDDDDDDDDWDEREPLGVDGNGLLTERLVMGDQAVIVHYDDVPPSDVTEVRGIPCTTPLRTLIDIAPDLSEAQLLDVFGQMTERQMFTFEEAWQRIRQPDMQGRRGAELVRRLLPPIEE